MMKNSVPKFYDNLGSVERFKKATVVPHVAKKINQFCKTSGADGESTHVGYFPKICRMDKPLDLNFYIGMVQLSGLTKNSDLKVVLIGQKMIFIKILKKSHFTTSFTTNNNKFVKIIYADTKK